MPVYVKKYKGNNYFQTRLFVDSLTLDKIPVDGLPVFRFETEDPVGIGSYRGGEFDLAISLLQPDKSQAGKTIKEFFLGEERDCYYLVILAIGSQCFSGIARQEQISADFTYSQNRYELRLTCKDMLIEFRNRCSAIALASLQISNGENLTFEEYILRHLGGIAGDVLLINLPEGTYLQRLQPYGNPAGCWVYGDFYNFITGKENISRWEAWKEFCKGVGMNFEMNVNMESVSLNEPEFIFNLFFIKDLENAEPVTVDVIEHREITSPPRMEWLYLRYRSLILSGVDYSSGIFFNGTDFYDSDSDNANNRLFPACALTMNNKVLRYIDENQITQKTVLRDVDFSELELKMYHYDLSTGGGFQKLYSLEEADGGGIAYSRILNCWTGQGFVIDRYDFKPVQRFTVSNYLRYLKSLNRTIDLDLRLNKNSLLRNWKIIRLSGQEFNKYYLRTLRNINLDKMTLSIECSKI
jgi:hypothetical protein